MSTRPAAVTMNVRQRAQSLLSPLNLHLAGIAVVGVINLYLLVTVILLYNQAKGQDAEAVSKQEIALKSAKIASHPLEGLDVKLKRASSDADQFSMTRLPVSYSEIASELGALAKKQNVRLTRVQYAQASASSATQNGPTAAALQGASQNDPASQLTEVRMDASLTGDYRPLVVFLNNLERDRLFFVITGITLSGQQSGVVNLRIRITTYIRGTASEEEMQRVSIGNLGNPGADAQPADDAAAAATAAQGKGGTL